MTSRASPLAERMTLGEVLNKRERGGNIDRAVLSRALRLELLRVRRTARMLCLTAFLAALRIRVSMLLTDNEVGLWQPQPSDCSAWLGIEPARAWQTALARQIYQTPTLLSSFICPLVVCLMFAWSGERRRLFGWDG